jgi:hypothetical protein
VVDSGGYDEAGLETFHLGSFKDGAHRLAIIIDSNGCGYMSAYLLLPWLLH